MPDPGPPSLIRRGNRGSGKKEAPVLSVLHDRLKWTAERLRRHFSKNNPARAGVVQQNPGAGLWTAEKHRHLGARRALVDLCRPCSCSLRCTCQARSLPILCFPRAVNAVIHYVHTSAFLIPGSLSDSILRRIPRRTHRRRSYRHWPAQLAFTFRPVRRRRPLKLCLRMPHSIRPRVMD